MIDEYNELWTDNFTNACQQSLLTPTRSLGSTENWRDGFPLLLQVSAGIRPCRCLPVAFASNAAGLHRLAMHDSLGSHRICELEVNRAAAAEGQPGGGFWRPTAGVQTP